MIKTKGGYCMNEKAISYIIFFAVMIFMNQWFNKWILYKAYESAGLTIKQVLDYRASLRGSNNQPRKLTAWILRVSPNPKKTRRLLNLYNLSMAPSIICLNISVMGLTVNSSKVSDGNLTKVTI